MTAGKAGALKDEAVEWNSIDWKEAQHEVRRLQVRIAKAVKDNRWNKVKTLQYLLTHSFYAKLVAVKRVTSNKGKNTPGVDGILWQGARAKWRAACSLRRRGYKPQPLRRIYIPKRNGKLRPLSIPCMYDRAQQALYKLALAPVAETTADKNSYGFREYRSCADAIEAGFNALSHRNSAAWVLEGDIEGCFDNISFQWMLDNIPMDKLVLQKWLRTGYMENGILYPSYKGVPQGGIISPTLSNMVLDGLEKAVHCAVSRQVRVNFIRYADDFIITGKSRTILEDAIKPVVEAFLAERGLGLSPEKTLITHIKDGFTFLGQTFRKDGKVLHIKPCEQGVLALEQKVGTLIHKHVSAPMPVLIKELNQILGGWADYHRHVVASEAFSRVDKYVYERFWHMLQKRHPHKSAKWLVQHYRTAIGPRGPFAVKVRMPGKKTKIYALIRVSSLGIRRHVKIRAAANPYMPEDTAYFMHRRHSRKCKLRPAQQTCMFSEKFGAIRREATQPGCPTRTAPRDA